MSLLALLLTAINARKARVLMVAEVALPEGQFKAYRSVVLDEFGRKGLESDLERIVADYERRNGKEAGGPTHAGKEVPHD